jgi:hypothetical protein
VYGFERRRQVQGDDELPVTGRFGLGRRAEDRRQFLADRRPQTALLPVVAAGFPKKSSKTSTFIACSCPEG